MTVQKVSKVSGVSIRTLHYYDQIGLLKPAEVTEAGYRLYDDTSLAKLQSILLFRELEFPLRDIKAILDDPHFDAETALRQQIKLLELKKEHIENLIVFARGIQRTGAKAYMDFSAFDAGKLDRYMKQAKEQWGNSAAYHDYEQKAKGQTREEQRVMTDAFMKVFAGFAALKDQQVHSEAVQTQVEVLKDFITEHFYPCTDDILQSLGQMYADGGAFTKNIDGVCGEGTAVFAGKAIAAYTGK